MTPYKYPLVEEGTSYIKGDIFYTGNTLLVYGNNPCSVLYNCRFFYEQRIADLRFNLWHLQVTTYT